MCSPLAQQILTEYPNTSHDQAGAFALVARQVARTDNIDPDAPIRTQLAKARRLYLDNVETGDFARAARKTYKLTDDEANQLWFLVTCGPWPALWELLGEDGTAAQARIQDLQREFRWGPSKGAERDRLAVELDAATAAWNARLAALPV